MRFVTPMAALLVDALPSGDEWLYEAKFDGYRALVMKNGPAIRILSRKGNDLTATYPAVVRTAEKLKARRRPRSPSTAPCMAPICDAAGASFSLAARRPRRNANSSAAASSPKMPTAVRMLRINGVVMDGVSARARSA